MNLALICAVVSLSMLGGGAGGVILGNWVVHRRRRARMLQVAIIRHPASQVNGQVYPLPSKDARRRPSGS